MFAKNIRLCRKYKKLMKIFFRNFIIILNYKMEIGNK